METTVFNVSPVENSVVIQNAGVNSAFDYFLSLRRVIQHVHYQN